MDMFDDSGGDAAHPVSPWKMLLGGLPDLATALMCWMAWRTPAILGAAWVKTLVVVVMAEFFVIHSGAFMGIAANLIESRRQRILFQLGLVLFYGLFVFALATALDETWLYAIFGWLFLSKLLVSWSANRGRLRAVREQMIDWPFAVTAYLGSLFTGFMAFEHARGGITPQVFADAGLVGAGLMEDQPWQALAGGCIYFALMSIWRMRIWRW